MCAASMPASVSPSSGSPLRVDEGAAQARAGRQHQDRGDAVAARRAAPPRRRPCCRRCRRSAARRARRARPGRRRRRCGRRTRRSSPAGWATCRTRRSAGTDPGMASPTPPTCSQSRPLSARYSVMPATQPWTTAERPVSRPGRPLQQAGGHRRAVGPHRAGLRRRGPAVRPDEHQPLCSRHACSPASGPSKPIFRACEPSLPRPRLRRG